MKIGVKYVICLMLMPPMKIWLTLLQLSLINIVCPVEEVKIIDVNTNKPWFTYCLLNACKKQNVLYKSFLKYRNEKSDWKYKIYKNKLTRILRKAEDFYYNANAIKCIQEKLINYLLVTYKSICLANENWSEVHLYVICLMLMPPIQILLTLLLLSLINIVLCKKLK